ncbi:hypothetical protein MKW98_007232 [Papaver atlanticum]|uniref:Uncharacterized protein n=1 Tax=Papaver atlanticum TaxID=357466 RepID=A0AAD4SN82_9MAGN|nr:hypothetical protein MKW98_007232 [Papaver atlanticum]
MKNSDAYSGAVELYILKDRIKQVWLEETIAFDRPVTRGIPPPTGIKIQIIELAGRIFLHWGEFLVREGIKNPIIYFYDLQSRKVNEVRLGSKFTASNNHVENLICLRAWATKEGDGEKLGLIYDTSTLKIIQYMFKQMPPTLGAAVSFFSSSRGITMS